MIPARFFRCVSEIVNDEHEAFWEAWQHLHPGWEFRTFRDPIDPADWPMTGHLFADCVHGAQIAGLIRLEALYRWGGIYVDADFEPLQPLDELRPLNCFIGTQDGSYLTDALIGATQEHAAIGACIARVLTLRMSAGPLVSGPDNTTAVLTGRKDVTILASEMLYPYSHTERHRRHEDFRVTVPNALAVHHWDGSWLRTP